jgi:hypothetical protein
MRMKASLLSSLAYRPRLLVLDEPFSGLDVVVRDEFVRGVLELSEQERETEVAIERITGPASTPTFAPMSLREIFVALAKAYRLTDGRAAA